MLAVGSLAALSVARLPAAATGPAYGMIDLGTLGGDYSEATGINNAGQVVGGSYTAGGAFHAFVYSGGKMTDLGTLAGGNQSEAEGINSSGQITGWSTFGSVDSQGSPEVDTILYTGGKMTDLGVLAGDTNSLGFAINDSGVIVGKSYTYYSANGLYADQNAFIFANGKMTKLGPLPGGFFSGATGINAAGTAAGWSDTGNKDSSNNLEYHAVRYAAGGGVANLGVPLGETNSIGQGINASGNVTGYVYSTNGANTAFVYSNNGGIKLLGALPHGFNSLGIGINLPGQVVGQGDIGVQDAQGNLIYHAFLYTGGALYDLNNLCLNSKGWRIEYAAGINDSGQIAAYALGPSGQVHAVLLEALVTSPPIITTQPVKVAVKTGGSATFTVAAISGTTFRYQWEKNGVPITGATSAKLTLTKVTAANAGTYTALVTNAVGNVTSSKATLTVNVTPASITTQPKSVSNVKAGATVTFKVVAKGDIPINYQWQFNGGNLTNSNNYTGATTATLTIKNANAGNAGNYQVLVWNAANQNSPAKSAPPAQLKFK